MTEIKEITSTDAGNIFESGEEGNREPRGLFIVSEDDGSITAIDNELGCAWTENFKDREQAVTWLSNSNLEAEDVRKGVI